MYTRQEVYKFIEDHYRANQEQLVKKNQHRMGGWHNAEDIIQETYTRALQYWESFEQNGVMDHWIDGIMRNCAVDKFKEEVTHGMSEAENELVDFVPQMINQIYLDDVTAFINAHEHKDILNLFFLKQMTIKEISQIVPQSPTNIGVIIWRFRKELFQTFKGKVFE